MSQKGCECRRGKWRNGNKIGIRSSWIKKERKRKNEMS
jgi:hypothetical protein